MCKALFIILFCLAFTGNAFAKSYYFKNCFLNEGLYANYIIDFDKNEINVRLEKTDGTYQELTDKIAKIQEDKISSEKIKSGAGDNSYFIYYLDVKSESVIKQKYTREIGINLIRPDGPKKQSYCKDVKANWHEDKKKKYEKEQLDHKAKEELKIKEEKEKLRLEAEKKSIKQKNRHKILIIQDKWIKFSEYTSNSGKQLKTDFDNKANELCSTTGNFFIIEKKINLVEIDNTPTFGTETVVKLGISGVIECK